jgi:hypothetical protein
MAVIATIAGNLAAKASAKVLTFSNIRRVRQRPEPATNPASAAMLGAGQLAGELGDLVIDDGAGRWTIPCG